MLTLIAEIRDKGSLGDASISADGEYVATATNHEAKLWEVANRTMIVRIEHSVSIRMAEFSPDGRHLATGDSDDKLKVSRVPSGQYVFSEILEGEVREVTFSANGTRISAPTWFGLVWVWETATGKKIATLKHGSEITTTVLSRDGTRLATADKKGSIWVWDVDNAHKVVHRTYEDRVISLAFDPKERCLAAFAKGSKWWTRDIIEDQIISRVRQDADLNYIDLSPNGKYLVGENRNSYVLWIWDMSNGAEIVYAKFRGAVTCWAFSRDHALMAIASTDKTLKLIRLYGERRTLHTMHERPIRKVSFSTDGEYLLTADSGDSSGEFTVKVWSIAGI